MWRDCRAHSVDSALIQAGFLREVGLFFANFRRSTELPSIALNHGCNPDTLWSSAIRHFFWNVTPGFSSNPGVNQFAKVA